MLRPCFVARVASELRRLVPLLDTSFSRAPWNASHLILATAHASHTAHTSDCPIAARLLPFTSLATDASFLRHPCTTCVRRRVHFLASVDFTRQVGDASANGPAPPPPALRAAVDAQFGSLEALHTEWITVSAARMAPGWTWLVLDAQRPSGQRLVLLNTPNGRTPLDMGLWPLAATDATERRLLHALSYLSNAPNVEAKAEQTERTVPAWSRAARHGAKGHHASFSHLSGTPTCAEGEVPLGEVRVQVARAAVERLDWVFVQRQWEEAEAYYASAGRAEKVKSRRAQLEREAALAAMSQLHNSGATILTSDTLEITIPGTREETKETQPVTEVPDEVKVEEANKVRTSESKQDDPQCVQLTDGTWEYRYRSGDVTLLRPDGTRVFRRPNLTTTVHTDGSTLFEYPNGTSILDRADGVRVTTFADGTKREERIK